MKDISTITDFILSKVIYGKLYRRIDLLKIGRGLYGVRDDEIYLAINNLKIKGRMYYAIINKTRGYFWKV